MIAQTSQLPKQKLDKQMNQFKIVGFYPGWAGNCIHSFPLDLLTHINYAFAIPREDGTVFEIDQPKLVRELISFAHDKGIRVGLAVGGWSYQDIPLEDAFVLATENEDKRKTFVQSILNIVDKYGFDGVDMDWEYPKPNLSAKQYEMFMILLKAKLQSRNKFLSASVIAFDPTVGKGQTDYVLHLVDWINIMAYDSNDEGGHASITIANQSIHYWLYQRKVPNHKIVLGLPFYSRPNYKTFCEIVDFDPDAAKLDRVIIDGVLQSYNGIETIVSKTKWAICNAGGVMIWEVTQDTYNESLSLLHAIARTVHMRFDSSKEKTDKFTKKHFNTMVE